MSIALPQLRWVCNKMNVMDVKATADNSSVTCKSITFRSSFSQVTEIVII